MLKSNLKQLGPTQAESAAPQRREGERSESSRSGGVADSATDRSAPLPDPEVPANPKRRQFTAEYKRLILDQAEACRDGGAIGALLRRRGVGRSAVRLVLDRFDGSWEIIEYLRNPGAVSFWRKVIALYTAGNYEERVVSGEVRQTFRSGNGTRRQGPLEVSDSRRQPGNVPRAQTPLQQQRRGSGT